MGELEVKVDVDTDLGGYVLGHVRNLPSLLLDSFCVDCVHDISPHG